MSGSLKPLSYHTINFFVNNQQHKIDIDLFANTQLAYFNHNNLNILKKESL